MPELNLKPNHKAVRDYYATLQQYEQHDITYEGAVSSPFETLLHACAKQVKATLVPQYPMHAPKGNRIVIDGAIRRFHGEQRVTHLRNRVRSVVVGYGSTYHRSVRRDGQLHRPSHAGHPRHSIRRKIPSRTPLQRSDAPALLHRQSQHRAGVLSTHGDVSTVNSAIVLR